MSEIRLRATAQIGKISRELEESKGGANPKATLIIGEKSKAEQPAVAGISVPTANRYEQLAAPEEQLAPAVESAMENYFAATAVGNKEPTLEGLLRRYEARAQSGAASGRRRDPLGAYQSLKRGFCCRIGYLDTRRP